MSDDLLDEMQDDAPGDAIDLLETMTDAGAPAWVPDEAGEGIQGVLKAIEEQDDDYNPGEMVPVWTIEPKAKDGEEVEAVRVIGFASVLRREMNKAKPEVGDTVAVKYFGEKELTKGKFKGKPYKLFKVAVRRK